MHDLAPALLAVLGICVAGLLARRTGVPSPVLLVLGGLAVAALPGAPTVELDPQVVLVLVLPPLLYSAAIDASLTGFRANARPIALLSVGLVVFTALVVGAVARLVVPGLPWAAALALGAVVAPPDAVAAIAIGRRVGLPARLQTVIEGEGLLNDATALVLYQVAVAVAVGGSFSVGRTVGMLLLAAGGGLVVGLGVAWVISQVRQRLEEPLVENVLSLATPFLAYLPAERIHASGVLAVVVCGLVLGHATTTLLSSTSRLQTQPVWRVVVFLLEGGVFLLIGLQLPEILGGLDTYGPGQLAGGAAVVVLAVLLSRPLWVVPAMQLPQRLSAAVRTRDPSPSWQATAALSWAGMRGVVSLAAAFALPLTTDDGAPFPRRDLLLFLVFVVILSTLLLQGLTFGRLLRALGLRPDRRGLLLAQASAQQSAVRAALTRLDEAVTGSPADEPVAEQLRRLAEARANARWERLAEVGAGGGGGPANVDPTRGGAAQDDTSRGRAADRGAGGDPASGGGAAETPSATWRRLRALMLEAERAELLRLRDAGQLPDEAMREMQRGLDLEEAALSSA